MKKNKIKRSNFIHRLIYRTFSDSELLRYSISCFIAGVFFVIISEKIEHNTVKNILATIGSFPIAFSYFLFPFIKNKEKHFMKFIGYFILISLTFIITFFLITFCFLCIGFIPTHFCNPNCNYRYDFNYNFYQLHIKTHIINLSTYFIYTESKSQREPRKFYYYISQAILR